MFKKQEEVFKDFMLLEGINIKEYSFDINCLEDQQLLKDFLQIRFIEELTEATADLKNKDHFKEEIIDALNFLMEAYILYGYNYSDLQDWLIYVKGKKDLNYYMYSIIQEVGNTCNLLKNRPWKQSQYLVDLYIFEHLFKNIWILFNILCCQVEIKEEELFEVWSLKYQVNKFRIKTRY
jgi:hypothetical protein